LVKLSGGGHPLNLVKVEPNPPRSRTTDVIPHPAEIPEVEVAVRSATAVSIVTAEMAAVVQEKPINAFV